ncbi:DUF4268 domain-containing protein [Cellulophaga baltica]|uniref:DUF4268 domain-containing protein n=1 Tax=Cellulophaga TaxID=104264 RepID=UPI001C06B60B|nr:MULTISPECIES: DUF4268 domain-containing protein [Cellulophaga]MBU2996613.1 DUF4268 domain-containing protein [Cellulophaga baltica]MDO6768007.1 DUF4268 domain-containing protein [Cellulophaga sp. 1_MG-2023]
MYSKEEAKKLRQDFWISFGKSFPRKWILYNTKIKDFSFKFHFDKSQAMVSMDIENKNLEKRIELWDKLTSLKSVLETDYIANVTYQEYVYLDNQRDISRLYISIDGVSIHNKNTWQETMIFLNETMLKFEAFFYDFEDMLID